MTPQLQLRSQAQRGEGICRRLPELVNGGPGIVVQRPHPQPCLVPATPTGEFFCPETEIATQNSVKPVLLIPYYARVQIASKDRCLPQLWAIAYFSPSPGAFQSLCPRNYRRGAGHPSPPGTSDAGNSRMQSQRVCSESHRPSGAWLHHLPPES